MQRMVYGVMFKANDVSHTIVCSPLVGIHDRARQNMALYYWQERFGDPRSALCSLPSQTHKSRFEELSLCDTSASARRETRRFEQCGQVRQVAPD